MEQNFQVLRPIQNAYLLCRIHGYHPLTILDVTFLNKQYLLHTTYLECCRHETPHLVSWSVHFCNVWYFVELSQHRSLCTRYSLSVAMERYVGGFVVHVFYAQSGVPFHSILQHDCWLSCCRSACCRSLPGPQPFLKSTSICLVLSMSILVLLILNVDIEIYLRTSLLYL